MLGLLICGSASAITLPCSPDVVFQISARDRDGNGSNIASVRLEHPAVFPKKAYTTYAPAPYRMTCPGFEAVATPHALTVTGNMATIWAHLKSKSSEAGTVHFFFDEGYIYPEIQEEYFRALIQANFVAGKLHFDADGLFTLFNPGIIGARVNGGPFQPVWFEGRRTQVKYGPTDVVELYATRGEGDVTYAPQISYMRIDFRHGSVTIRDDVKFPSK